MTLPKSTALSASVISGSSKAKEIAREVGDAPEKNLEPGKDLAE